MGRYTLSLTTDEKRVTNPDTGGAKGQKLERTDLIPAEALLEVARVYGKGAEKYEENNWRKGYKWSLSYGALMRHALSWQAGEDIDPETGCHHMACVVFHALALIQFAKTHPEFDDRPKKEKLNLHIGGSAFYWWPDGKDRGPLPKFKDVSDLM